MITHHPHSGLLLDYAAGSLAEPVALAVATHACLCPICRAEVAGMESVGGALLHDIEPARVSGDALAQTLARLDAASPAPATAPAPSHEFDEETKTQIPGALRPYLGGDLRSLRWRWQGPDLREARLPLDRPGFRASLFRLRPGGHPPSHTHAGNEYIVVLSGSFTEDGDVFDTGDFAHADQSKTHIQVADAREGCLCLAVLDAPVRLRGLVGGLVNPFLRF